MVLGLRAAAKELGISHVALLKAWKAGRVKRTSHGNFDIDHCRAALQLNTQPKLSEYARRQQQKPGADLQPETHPDEGQRTAPDSGVVSGAGRGEDALRQLLLGADLLPETNSVAEATRQLEWEKVRRERLKNDLAEAKLTDVAAVNAFVAGMIIKARDELLRIPAEVRDDLARNTDPIDCEEIVRKRITGALQHMAEFKSVA